MAYLYQMLFTSCIFVTFIASSHIKKCNTKFHGCSISNGMCECDTTKGCLNPFPYSTEEECWDDLEGRNDKCEKHPCRNGQCVQVKDFENSIRKWHCECAGTGFYGSKCQHKCPKLTDPLPKDYPVPCIY